MLSNVSDEELAILYQECLFSVYPSFYEGWGLPVTEALCYGKPVLVSRSSALPEAGGEVVDYFDLGDAADLSARLEKLIFDPSYRAEREATIRTDFKARSWQSIAEDLQKTIAEWSVRASAGWKIPPALEFKRYYAFSRNTDVEIYRGLQSGELFRSGNGWWGADEWGCWLKPGPAEITFSLPDSCGACRLYVGLRGPDGTDTPFDMTILPHKKIMGVLKPGATKWVVLEFDAADTGVEVYVVLEGFTRQEVRQRADLNPIAVSIGVIGLFVCASSDMDARVRFAEAVSLDDMTSLARGTPPAEFARGTQSRSGDSRLLASSQRFTGWCMPTRVEVIWAYRILLGREPESEDVIQTGMTGHINLAGLLRAFLNSDEFRARNDQRQRHFPLTSPPIEVEWQVEPAAITTIIRQVSETWQVLGEIKPHWSVLSSDEYLPENIPSTEQAFYASGEVDLQIILSTILRAGRNPDDFHTVLEYGCGLGRVTHHLAAKFPRVIACDISSSHLRLARSAVAQRNGTNVTFVRAEPPHFGMTADFDLWNES